MGTHFKALSWAFLWILGRLHWEISTAFPVTQVVHFPPNDTLLSPSFLATLSPQTSRWSSWAELKMAPCQPSSPHEPREFHEKYPHLCCPHTFCMGGCQFSFCFSTLAIRTTLPFRFSRQGSDTSLRCPPNSGVTRQAHQMIP